jgi:hypothetical protein
MNQAREKSGIPQESREMELLMKKPNNAEANRKEKEELEIQMAEDSGCSLDFLRTRDLESIGSALGTKRMLRLKEAARRVDREKGLEVLNDKFGLFWVQGSETIAEYRERIENIIYLFMKPRKSRQRYPKKIMSNFKKAVDYFEYVIDDILNDERMPKRLSLSDIDRIEKAILKLRKAVKKEAGQTQE